MEVDVAKAAQHVADGEVFDFPFGLELEIPQVFGEFFPITKFMVLELAAALLMLLIFVPLASGS